MNAGYQAKTVRSLENACRTWAPYRCVHGETLYKSTFTLPLPYSGRRTGRGWPRNTWKRDVHVANWDGGLQIRYSWRNTKAPAQLFSLPRDWWREKWSAAYAALGAIRYISQASHYRNCFTFCIGATLQQSYSKKQRVSLRHWLPGRYNFISV